MKISLIITALSLLSFTLLYAIGKKKAKENKTRTIRQQVFISLPLEQVWNTFKDIGNTHKIMPSVKSCRSTSDPSSGLGATREMTTVNNAIHAQKVTSWKEMDHYTLTSTDIQKEPLSFAEITFSFRPMESGTTLSLEFSYQTKGLLVNLIGIHPLIKKGIRATILGTKHNLENGESLDLKGFKKIIKRYEAVKTDVN